MSTKTGTTVNGHKFKGETYTVTSSSVDIKLGSCPDLFRYDGPLSLSFAPLRPIKLLALTHAPRLSWHPVALAFSFTSRELQTDPFSRLRDSLEQLDIKISHEYNIRYTTHVVSKKRNTPKGLQALINGRCIVTDGFVDAIIAAARRPEDGDPSSPSPLELDFDANWPNPLEYLPPRGGEPVERPTDAYAPDAGRQDVFEGYTFIFYDKTQFENLLAPITNGKGKALFMEVSPGQTPVDDFIRFVKTEAGEKGLGSFEDGSEGRGVVVVRYTPNKGDHMDWYADFFTQVSLRLDHRPIEQKEFLEAILIKDASILRRPLEVETPQDTPVAPAEQQVAPSGGEAMELDQSGTSQETSQNRSADSSAPAPAPAPRRNRARRAPTRRFAGFASENESSDDDAENNNPTPDVPPLVDPPNTEEENYGLFVSQEPDPMPVETAESGTTTQRTLRKRNVEDVLGGMLPTADAVKRRRIEAGEDPVPKNRLSSPPAAGTTQETESALSSSSKEPKAPPKKPKKELDVLEEARKRREALEAQARAEREDLATLPSDIDLNAIRRLHIVEEIKVRRPPSETGAGRQRSREKDIAEGRWNPQWNGRKNFKRFRQRGAPTGRPPMKVIIPLTEVKRKDYGIGDDYWLEDEGGKRANEATQQGSGSVQNSAASASLPKPSSSWTAQRIVVSDDSSEEDGSAVVKEEMVVVGRDEEEDEGSTLPSPQTATATRSTRSGTRSATRSQAQTQVSQRSTRAGKRSAPPAPAAREPAAKKPRATRRIAEVQDSDDESDDELQFKFGRRR